MNRLTTSARVALGSLLAVSLMFLSVRGQVLPRLNISPASNRVVNITWPYTDSGFVFQETTNLRTGPWQASGLLPAFNSNAGTFFVPTTTTNAANLFRLRQPADLRGIYVYVDLATATNSADGLAAKAALTQSPQGLEASAGG